MYETGRLAGSMEILVTYPLEYVKTQLQLQQQVRGPQFTYRFTCSMGTWAQTDMDQPDSAPLTTPAMTVECRFRDVSMRSHHPMANRRLLCKRAANVI